MKEILALMQGLMTSNPFDHLDTSVYESKDRVRTSDCIKQDVITVSSDLHKSLKKASAEKTHKLCIDIVGGSKKTIIPVFIIPALFREVVGDKSVIKLVPDFSHIASMNTDLLLSRDHKPSMELGDFDEYATFPADSLYDKDVSWSKWVENSLTLLTHVCKCQLIDIVNKPKLNIENASLVISIRKSSNESPGSFTERLYDYLSDVPEKLLHKTCLKNIDALYSNKFEAKYAKDNFLPLMLENLRPGYLLAHMDENNGSAKDGERLRSLHPLDNTQRQVNISIPYLKEGDVLAVNGPPGSGKTAMLKAVVSHAWVEGALVGKECPIILGVGGTNQSVTNIVNAFPDTIYQGDDSACQYMKRWFDAPLNYGTYFPSNGAYKGMAPKIRDNAVLGEVLRNDEIGLFVWKGKYKDVSDYACIDAFKKSYLFNASESWLLPDIEYWDLKKAVDGIREALQAKYNDLKKKHSELREFFKTQPKVENIESLTEHAVFDYLFYDDTSGEAFSVRDSFLSLFSEDESDIIDTVKAVCRENIRDEYKDNPSLYMKNLEEIRKNAGLILIDRLLDVTIRFCMFHIAARYWEGRYLLECENNLFIKPTSDNIEASMRQMCMLTPCLVATVQSAPKLFQYRGTQGISVTEHLLGKADLMIIDEGGQAEIRISLPLLALANKTLCVGDIEQIPPIVDDITAAHEQQSFNFLVHSLLGSGKESPYDFRRCLINKLTPKSGSILHVLRHISLHNWQGRGLSLRGHYRCQRVLSQFCNELVYGNTIFIEGFLNNENGPLPPLTWASSQYKTQRIGTSHVSKPESDLVASWLLDSWPTFKAHYSKNGKDKEISDIVAIITPYAEQADFLRASIDEKLAEYPEGYLPKGAEEKLVIGTINALQGAERPIVIYSGVKGIKTPGGLHFKDDSYILNVAISRAKDCFVSFLCPEQYGIGLKYTDEELKALKSQSVEYFGHYLTQNAKKLFPNKLVIIEAAGKVKTLQKFLGCDYKVVCTNGKILKCNMKEQSLNYRSGLHPSYKWMNEKGASAYLIMEGILEQSLDEDISEIIVATDDDFVGDQIAWQIKTFLVEKEATLEPKLKRVQLRGLSQDEVDKAFSRLNDFDEQASTPEYVREIVDILIARKMMKILGRNFNNTFTSSSPMLEQGVEQRLVQQLEEHEDKSFGVGRVKAGILSLLKEHLISQLDSVDEKGIRPVEVEVNGKIIKANIYAESEECFNPDNVKKLESKNSWDSHDYHCENTTLEPPSASTIAIMKYASKKNNMSVVETYEALISLYEGRFTHEKE